MAEPAKEAGRGRRNTATELGPGGDGRLICPGYSSHLNTSRCQSILGEGSPEGALTDAPRRGHLYIAYHLLPL